MGLVQFGIGLAHVATVWGCPDLWGWAFQFGIHFSVWQAEAWKMVSYERGPPLQVRAICPT